MSQPELVCSQCQPTEAENASLRQALQSLQAEMNDLAEELAGSRGTQITLERQLRAAKAELRKMRINDPEAEKAQHLIDVWMRETGRAHRKGRKPDISISGKRGQTAIKALKLQNLATGEPYTVAELEMALIGLGLLPFVGAKGRKPTGQPKERYDEIEHALRDETTIDRFISYARRGAQAAAEQRDSIWDTYWRINALEHQWARLAMNASAAIEKGVETDDLVALLLRRDEEADALWVEILTAEEPPAPTDISRASGETARPDLRVVA